MVQLSYLYVSTGKTIALTIQTFVSKVMSLLFNTLSRFVIAFLPRRMLIQASCCCPDFRGRLDRKFSTHIWSYQNNFHVTAKNLTWKGVKLRGGLG